MNVCFVGNYEKSLQNFTTICNYHPCNSADEACGSSSTADMNLSTMPKNLCLYNEYFQYENELTTGPNPSIMHQVQINTNIDINNLQHYCNTTILPLTNYLTESTPTQTIVNLNSHHFISSVTKNQDQIYYEMNKNAIEESQISNQVLEENEDDVNYH